MNRRIAKKRIKKKYDIPTWPKGMEPRYFDKFLCTTTKSIVYAIHEGISFKQWFDGFVEVLSREK